MNGKKTLEDRILKLERTIDKLKIMIALGAGMAIAFGMGMYLGGLIAWSIWGI